MAEVNRMNDGRPRAPARIYKHGRLITGKELEKEQRRIMGLRFHELLAECKPITQKKVDYIKELVGDIEIEINLDEPLNPDDE